MSISIAPALGAADDPEYNAYRERIQARFDAVMKGGRAAFTTDAGGLFKLYLEGLPEADRQHCTCHACRVFVERFGGLATIDEAGASTSPIWCEDDAPDRYKVSAKALAAAVRRARVTGVFLAADVMWGTPQTGQWSHFAIRPMPHLVHRHGILSAGQAMAEKREEFGIVSRALAEWDLRVIETALGLLETSSLYRSETVKGPVLWLRDLHIARAAAKGADRSRNVVWRAVAAAPAGFCHPRSSMAGTLLDDIAAGMSFEDAARRFAAKMHPLQYQRPQAAPSAANIAEGERIIAALGCERSLARRIARLDEVEMIWRPSPAQTPTPSTGGVFAHLRAREAAPSIAIDAPPVVMTWDKFQRSVLPTAEAADVLAPARGNYTALVTAVHQDAPPIIQWDRLDRRNPVTWYVWHGGASASQFSLPAGSGGVWQKLSGICLKPNQWHGTDDHHGKGVVMLIDGARETRTAGLALFPELLRSELRSIRATIEAYSKAGTMEGLADGSACGLMMTADSNGSWNVVVRVTAAGRVTKYALDRWD